MPKTLTYWYPLFIISVVMLLDNAGYGLIAPVVPDFASRMNLTPVQVSLLYSLYGLVLLVIPVPFGVLADRLDRKAFLYFGLLGKAFALLGFAMVETYAGLLMVRTVDAVAGMATWTVGLALLADFYPQEAVGSKFGITMAASEVGSFMGPLFSGPVADWFGDISPPFYLMSFFCAAAAVLVVFMPRPKPTISTRPPFRDIKTLISTKKVLILGVLFLLGASFQGMLGALYPLHLSNNLGFSRTEISILFAVIAGTFIIFMPVVGALSSRFNLPFLIPLGLTISALTAPGLVLFTNIILLLACMILHSLGWVLYYAPAFPLFTQAVRDTNSQFGIAFGLVNAFWAAGFMAGPILSGGLMMIWGIRAPFIAFSSIMLVMVLVFAASTSGKNAALSKNAEPK